MILKLVRLINNETENFNEKYHERNREKFHCESLKCPNCGSHELISYGTYTRNILVHDIVSTQIFDVLLNFFRYPPSNSKISLSVT